MQREEIITRLERLYPQRGAEIFARAQKSAQRYAVKGKAPDDGPWSGRDVILITYAHTVHSEGEVPLRSLAKFLECFAKDSFSIVHILPFFPYSSDDGFSVMDFRKVNAPWGDWEDIAELGNHYRLMFDLVLNHVSAQSEWFANFLEGKAPYERFFMEMQWCEALSDVVRPRATPLLTAFTSEEGLKQVWTTFSADQVDLNWREAEVFAEFVDILFFYLSEGARLVRLDAVGFLWKELGTSCMHLPQTHEVIQLLRALLEYFERSALIVTETNVPHEENISYFDEGQEAHMVYQFSLPPLVLHGLLRQDATKLSQWAQNLEPPPKGCTFFNFTASHDGIGMRPLQGILPEEEITYLVQKTLECGGKVSYRDLPNGQQAPYELNTSYFSILAQGENGEIDGRGIARFLCSQAVALCLQGVPALYIHSFLGTCNDVKGYEETGRARSLNRKTWDYTEIVDLLENENSHHSRVRNALEHIIRVRQQCAAFHPEASQEILMLDPRVFTVRRTARDRGEAVTCLHNFSESSVSVTLPEELTRGASDILHDQPLSKSESILLESYQVTWILTNREEFHSAKSLPVTEGRGG